MNSSPITSWEGASTYFTFADSPVMIAIFFHVIRTCICYHIVNYIGIFVFYDGNFFVLGIV